MNPDDTDATGGGLHGSKLDASEPRPRPASSTRKYIVYKVLVLLHSCKAFFFLSLFFIWLRRGE